MSTDDELDKWAVWVIHRRDGGDVAQRKKGAEHLLPIRMVYSTEPISRPETSSFVGAGDGLIAFWALDRSPSSHVIVSDVSPDLLAHTRELAEGLSLEDRVTFVEAHAGDLSRARPRAADRQMGGPGRGSPGTIDISCTLQTSGCLARV